MYRLRLFPFFSPCSTFQHGGSSASFSCSSCLVLSPLFCSPTSGFYRSHRNCRSPMLSFCKYVTKAKATILKGNGLTFLNWDHIDNLESGNTDFHCRFSDRLTVDTVDCRLCSFKNHSPLQEPMLLPSVNVNVGSKKLGIMSCLTKRE